MFKIALTGPESSGKTSLSKSLSEALQCNWSAEYAREYLEGLQRPYLLEDLSEIAEQQTRRRKQELSSESDYHIYDTTILEIKVWAEERFGELPERIRALYQLEHVDLYLLCVPDLDWEEDPLRENPHDRMRLFSIYERHLKDSGKPYRIIEGKGQLRTDKALEIIRDFRA